VATGTQLYESRYGSFIVIGSGMVTTDLYQQTITSIEIQAKTDR